MIEEFNLSHKVFNLGSIKHIYFEKDIKKFIELLKNEINPKNLYNISESNIREIKEIINRLAGLKLI